MEIQTINGDLLDPQHKEFNDEFGEKGIENEGLSTPTIIYYNEGDEDDQSDEGDQGDEGDQDDKGDHGDDALTEYEFGKHDDRVPDKQKIIMGEYDTLQFIQGLTIYYDLLSGKSTQQSIKWRESVAAGKNPAGETKVRGRGLNDEGVIIKSEES